MGPPQVFSAQEELKMHEFLLEAWFLQIPRTQYEFSLDVKFMLDYTKRETRFTDNKPG